MFRRNKNKNKKLFAPERDPKSMSPDSWDAANEAYYNSDAMKDLKQRAGVSTGIDADATEPMSKAYGSASSSVPSSPYSSHQSNNNNNNLGGTPTRGFAKPSSPGRPNLLAPTTDAEAVVRGHRAPSTSSANRSGSHSRHNSHSRKRSNSAGRSNSNRKPGARSAAAKAVAGSKPSSRRAAADAGDGSGGRRRGAGPRTASFGRKGGPSRDASPRRGKGGGDAGTGKYSKPLMDPYHRQTVVGNHDSEDFYPLMDAIARDDSLRKMADSGAAPRGPPPSAPAERSATSELLAGLPMPVYAPPVTPDDKKKTYSLVTHGNKFGFEGDEYSVAMPLRDTDDRDSSPPPAMTAPGSAAPAPPPRAGRNNVR